MIKHFSAIKVFTMFKNTPVECMIMHRNTVFYEGRILHTDCLLGDVFNFSLNLPYTWNGLDWTKMLRKSSLTLYIALPPYNYWLFVGVIIMVLKICSII